MSSKLIVLYGVPGLGKLTIASELAKITDTPLFHNHLSADLSRKVFGKGNVPKGLVDEIRYTFFEFAAKEEKSLIFTFVYAFKIDDYFFEEVKRRVHTYGTKIYFIHLTCEEVEWYRRLTQEDRKQYHKVVEVEAVKETMSQVDLHLTYPKAEIHFDLDVTHLSPQESAKEINTFIQTHSLDNVIVLEEK